MRLIAVPTGTRASGTTRCSRRLPQARRSGPATRLRTGLDPRRQSLLSRQLDPAQLLLLPWGVLAAVWRHAWLGRQRRHVVLPGRVPPLAQVSPDRGGAARG